MNEPLTWEAIVAVAGMLSLITVANGYRTDIGEQVELDDNQIDEDEAPFVRIFADDIPVTTNGKRFVTSGVDIVIQAVLKVGTQSQLQAHRARADIIKALHQPLNGAVLGMTGLDITGSAIGKPADGSNVVIAQVTARAGLSETKPPA